MSTRYCLDRNQTNTCFGTFSHVPADKSATLIGDQILMDILLDNRAQVPTCPPDGTQFDCTLPLNASCDICRANSARRLGADLQKALDEASGVQLVTLVL
jgi:hypothetical protein